MFTQDEILKMQPGPELNALVVEYVFGFMHLIGDDVPANHRHLEIAGPQEVWLDRLDDNARRFCKWCGNMPHFSGDIADAWKVVEKVKGSLFSRRAAFLHELKSLTPSVAWPDVFWFVNPETICKAALLAQANPEGGPTDADRPRG